MSSPNTPLDPEKQPALVRMDAYEEWRKREGVPFVGGVYIKDMKAVEVGRLAAQGRWSQRRSLLLGRRRRGRRAHRRTPAGKLYGAPEAHVHRGNLCRFGTRFHLGLARQGAEADLRVGAGRLLCLADERLAPILQRQPLTERALVFSDRLAATPAPVGQRGFCLQQSLRFQRSLHRRAGLL